MASSTSKTFSEKEFQPNQLMSMTRTTSENPTAQDRREETRRGIDNPIGVDLEDEGNLHIVNMGSNDTRGQQSSERSTEQRNQLESAPTTESGGAIKKSCREDGDEDMRSSNRLESKNVDIDLGDVHDARYPSDDNDDESGSQSWRLPLEAFTSMKHGEQEDDRKLSRRVKNYYKQQDELIESYQMLYSEIDSVAAENDLETKRLRKWTSRLVLVCFILNCVLLVAKITAAALTGSLAIIAVLIDSAVDIISNILFVFSSRAIKKRNIYQYPQGRTKLEPIFIVILAVIMTLASAEVIRESVQKIIDTVNHAGNEGPNFDTVAIVIVCATVVIKIVLFILCYRIKTPVCQALALDHRNDVLSNIVALACGLIGDKVWPYADPIGAIVISCYIIISWFIAGRKQVKMLTGYTAKPDFLKLITWTVINHHPDIIKVDTVRAFHFGSNFLVEVDIVLPEEMVVRTAHDIGESLQNKLESMESVERAFVHIDYESTHSPKIEHKPT